MALDNRYVIAPSLQMYFVDKDTGLPLENGLVFFYEDQARTVPKDVFEISGDPPNYSYNVLPNPVSLSSVGTFQDDSGADIIPYYFPFDANGDIELYYIEVYNNLGVLQFTREGWPNFTSTELAVDQDVTNFVPNGQFLLHDNVPASSANTYIAGEISQDITVIAQGGWTFERGPSSTATDFVTFPRYAASVQNPTGNPRYAVQIQTTIAASDTRKDLCLKFPDVNTFASDTQSYNFYFEGQSGTGSDIANCQIIVRKFYGTGGSPSTTTEAVISSFTLLASSISQYNIPILFGTNAGKSIGTNNDDYVQIVLRLPPTSVQTAIFTDFALTVNDEKLISFPTQTNAQQIDPSTAGWFPTPDPNGFDLYCPAVLGSSGLLFDHSSIGEIIGLMETITSINGNLIFCDGTQFFTYDYSPLGIPYLRLQRILFDATTNGSLFGTGANFSDTYVSAGNTSQLMIITNKAGIQTNPTDAGSGFTINPISNPGTTGYGYSAYTDSAASVTAIGTTRNAVLNPVATGTSGMSVLSFNEYNINGFYYTFNVQAISATSLAAGSGISGKYFDFSSTTINYRMWFLVNGEIPPSAGGRTLIQINLASVWTAVDVGEAIAAGITGEQLNTITVTAIPPAGSYFTFTTSTVPYYVWYQINGAGIAPTQPFAQLIKIILTGSETTAQVAFKTQTAINSQYFAVPDLRGMFLRGADPTVLVDVNSASRYGYYRTNANYVGTFQVDEIRNHIHDLGNTATGGGGSVGAAGSGASTAPYGGYESRPKNAAIFWCIRY